MFCHLLEQPLEAIWATYHIHQLLAHTKHLTSLSPCQSEQSGCAATAELDLTSLAPSSLPAEGPARHHQLQENIT